MRIRIALLFSIASMILASNAGFAGTAFLEMTRGCDGVRLGETRRFPITDWDGRSKQGFSQTVYDFRIDCDGTRQSIMDVFLASIDDKRYEKRGNTLYKHTRDQSKRVLIPDSERGCRFVEDLESCTRTPDELYKICGGNERCSIKFLNYRCTKTNRECIRPRSEYRYVPYWEPFLTGYAPLPSGARLIEVAETPPAPPARNVSVAPAPPAPPAPRTTGTTSTTEAGGFGVGTFLFLVVVIGAGAFFWKPIARFYYSAFVPHPSKKYLDISIANNTALDIDSFERAMAQATLGPFPDIMAEKGARLRQAMDEHAEMMRSVEERERARTRAKASTHFGRQLDEDNL